MTMHQLHVPFWTRQQEEAFKLCLDAREYYLAMEPRCGKTKPVVEKLRYHFEHKTSPLHVTGAIVVAWPSGVHSGWIKDGFPDNLPPNYPWKGLVWRAKQTDTNYFRQAYKELVTSSGLAVLALNAEAVITDSAFLAMNHFMKKRSRIAFIADEASFMSGANTKRTKRLYALSQRSEVIWKMCLDGTPAGDQGPFDLFTQLRWLNPAILGITTNAEFKAKYAEWETVTTRGGKTFPKVATGDDGKPKYRNMDDLQRRLKGVMYRATYEQCFPNAARKRPMPLRYFELAPEQRRVYNEMRDQFKTEIAGTKFEAREAIVRMTRLQQIASNYTGEIKTAHIHEVCDGMGCDVCDGGVVIRKTPPIQIAKVNPRLEALKEEYQRGNRLLVWCRFRQDAADCLKAAKDMGISAARYDGSVDEKYKEWAKQAYQDREIDVLVCHERSAGRGIPLWTADGHVFYSHGRSFRDRTQAEDRAEIAHRKVSAFVITLVAEDTVDDNSIIPAFRQKMDVATYIMQDPKRAWL